MYYKDFDSWNSVKKRLQDDDLKVNIRKGEIRWVSFGVNVGTEIDGKGISFARPALILHVIGSHLALVIPMSTKVKNIAGYVPLDFKHKQVALCIHQIKVISQKRIFSRLGKISNKKLEDYKKMVAVFFNF